MTSTAPPRLAPPDPASRRFPAPGWAWPSGSRDLLLRAALLSDADAARAALMQWLEAHDLDDITFADHRLMAAIAERHGSALSDLSAYPRLKGLQRQLWTQSRLRLNATLPALQRLADAGIEIMLLKGAARIAVNPAAQRQRAQQDVDILVRPGQMLNAARLLVADGWQPGGGESALSAVSRAPSARAINFQLLPWGDIDLHHHVYHGQRAIADLDAGIWADAQPGEFFGIAVKVPSAYERLAMCISHGTWFPDTHSDWLVDAADMVLSSAVDWQKACEVFCRRKMVLQAQIVLGYLDQALGVGLPSDARSALGELRAERGLERAATLLAARPQNELSRPLASIRRACSAFRLYRRKRDTEAAGDQRSVSFACLYRHAAPTVAPALTRAFLSPVTDSDRARGSAVFSATILFESPRMARRIEFELNGPSGNLARFRVLSWSKGRKWLTAKLRTRIELSEGMGEIMLEARPGKLFSPAEPASRLGKYQAIPFIVLGWKLQPRSKT